MPDAPAVIAVDTNVLLDLVVADETVLDCFDTIRKRLPKAPILVPPTVIGELADLAKDEDDGPQALAALRQIRDPWGFQPINFIPVGHGIVEETARKIRAAGLIPGEEINDSFVVAEAALVNTTILLSSDAHLREIDHKKLKEILEACEVSPLIICSPWKIVNQFFS